MADMSTPSRDGAQAGMPRMGSPLLQAGDPAGCPHSQSTLNSFVPRTGGSRRFSRCCAHGGHEHPSRDGAQAGMARMGSPLLQAGDPRGMFALLEAQRFGTGFSRGRAHGGQECPRSQVGGAGCERERPGPMGAG
jgi:hypothetical protein